MPREILYQRINRRVDIMVEQGLFEETKALLEEGVEGDAQSMKSIGYRQVLRYFDGEWSRQECIDKIQAGHPQLCQTADYLVQENALYPLV